MQTLTAIGGVADFLEKGFPDPVKSQGIFVFARSCENKIHTLNQQRARQLISVSSAGDINGDGIDDLIIGAPGTGQSYVVFGSTSAFNGSLDLSNLNGLIKW